VTDAARRLSVLMTPGPVSVPNEVLLAMAAPSIFHRYGTFEELFERVTERLRVAFHATPQHDCVLFAGSGTLANEAVLSSCFGPDDKVLVASNGDFGDRLLRTLSIHGVPTVEHRRPAHSSLEPLAVVDRAVEIGASAVAVVAMETSTGVVNPVVQIGTALHSLGAAAPVLFVDAVSALGAEVVDVNLGAVAYCTSVLNKGLEGPAGLAFACIDRHRYATRRASPPRSVYLDLDSYLTFAERRQTPWTPAIPLIRALDVALERLNAETLEGRRSRYLRLSACLRERLVSLGFDTVTEPGTEASAAITCFVLPPRVHAASLRRFLENRGYVLWFPPGEDIRPRMIASVMGDVTERDVETVGDLITLFMTGAADETHWRSE